MDDFEVGAWAMVHWIYNTSGVAFAELAYGVDEHREYLNEKASLWTMSPTRALGFLGAEQKARVFAAVRQHAEAARATLR